MSHSEEQSEAVKLAAEGKKWGNAYCEMRQCKHQWIAIYVFQDDFQKLQCPECGMMSGVVYKPMEPL